MQQWKFPLYQEWEYTKSPGFISVARYKIKEPPNFCGWTALCRTKGLLLKYYRQIIPISWRLIGTGIAKLGTGIVLRLDKVAMEAGVRKAS